MNARGRASGVIFTGPAGNSYEIPSDMLHVAGRASELKAAADRVRKMAEALYAAADYAACAPYIKDATIDSCRDAVVVVERALLATNMSSDAVYKAVKALNDELVEIKIARDDVASRSL